MLGRASPCEGLEGVAARVAALYQDLHPLPRPYQDLVETLDRWQWVAVGRDLVQRVSVEREVEVGVGGGVEQAPALCLPGAHGHCRVDDAVDGVDLLAVDRARSLQHEEALRQRLDLLDLV